MTLWRVRHRLNRGKPSLVSPSPEWIAAHTVAAYCPPEDAREQSVDIVVPVYNGFDYLPRLVETIAQTQMRYRLLVIDDASPDPRVQPLLRQWVAHDSRVQLRTHAQNLGFVRTVNEALAQTTHHVVLLNTDIELPPHWLERLMAPLLADSTVASATPFSNSGALCSFPLMEADNPLPVDRTAREVDAAFARLLPAYTPLPTGVGFCMAMRREAIADIGGFDEAAFGRGYGEENDWCQRALARGYTHVAVENLFVYHKHGGSFLAAEKRALMRTHLALLQARYPGYGPSVNRFLRADPLRPYKAYAWQQLAGKMGMEEQAPKGSASP